MVYIEIEKPTTASRLLQSVAGGTGAYEGWAAVMSNLKNGTVAYTATYNFLAASLTGNGAFYTDFTGFKRQWQTNDTSVWQVANVTNSQTFTANTTGLSTLHA